MKHILLLVTTLFLFVNVYGQSSSDYAVMLTASVTENPPSITLHWNTYANGKTYKIYRKAKNSSSWGAVISTLDSSAVSFTDNNVVPDSGYEYRVSRTGGVAAEGYIYSSIKLHATDYRGKLLLIVDDTFKDSLSSEIFQLMKDISGDGWSVSRHDVSRNTLPTTVKSIIVNEYNTDPENTKAVLLLGHVPVPYSGNLNPDGHSDHRGAWPADVYYGDIDGSYTDSYVNDTTATRPANRNKIGDGKFDQSTLPSSVELQVGRIDLSNMPAFLKTEKQLLQQYLQRAHDYKFKKFTPVPRGLIDDNFGAFSGEAFASSAWRNFSPMFGDTAIHTKDYFTTLVSQNYQWSYGCGGGSYTSCSGVGSTTNFINDSVKTVFTMLFGSYFGDWDSQNNLLRAPLASPGLALTSCWSGRPYWFFHHMMDGENIGFSTMTTQNNSYLYPYAANYGYRFVHIALMGDPTLRQHVISPPANVGLSVTTGGSTVSLSWDASADAVDGYYVYRSTEEFGKYIRISPSIISSLGFVDSPPAGDLYFYFVKAVKWENTPSGTYLNTSEGIGDSVRILISNTTENSNSNNNFVLFPNPANEKISFISNKLFGGEIEIQNCLGQIVQTIKVLSETNRADINVKDLTSGFYLLVLKNENTTISRKFIKQ